MRWCIAFCAALLASASVVKCTGLATFVASTGGRPLGLMGTCVQTGGKMIAGLAGKAVIEGAGTCGGGRAPFPLRYTRIPVRFFEY